MGYEDGYWHKLVLRELKRLMVHGRLHALDPVTPPATFAKYEYIEDAEREYEVLTYFERMGIFRTEVGGIDEDAPYLFGIDVDGFEKELNRFGLRDAGTGLEGATDTHPSPSEKLGLKSYDAKTGILYLGGKTVVIIKQKNRINTKNETMQARAMRLLFSSVNSLEGGVPLRKIVNSTPVNSVQMKPHQYKQAKNHVAEINRKVKEVIDGPSLIKTTKHTFHINPIYL